MWEMGFICCVGSFYPEQALHLVPGNACGRARRLREGCDSKPLIIAVTGVTLLTILLSVVYVLGRDDLENV